MSTINAIPDVIIADMMRYSLPGSIDELKNVCKKFKTILANKSIWDLECKPLDAHIIYGNSIGTTALLIRASNATSSCVSCGSTYYGQIHKFYDVNLCQHCRRQGDFKTAGFKSTCAKYFLNPRDMMGNPNIRKVAHGSNYSVLVHKVKKESERRYPDGLLQEKLSRRQKMQEHTEARKRDCRNLRIASLRKFFFQKVLSIPERVHPDLRTDDGYSMVFALIGNMRVAFILRDLFALNISTRSDPRSVADDIKDFACMLSFLRKREVVDESFFVKPEFVDVINPGYIFRKHISGDGLHFYESIIEYIECNTSYLKRVSRVDQHLSTYNLSAMEKRQICVASCVEDGVNFEPSEFSEFIHTGVGNPVQIARKIRKDKFLTDNNVNVHIISFMHMGNCFGHSVRMAKERVLSLTLGYPPMLELMTVAFITPVNQNKKRRRLPPASNLQC